MNIKIEMLEQRHVHDLLPRMMDRHATIAQAMESNPKYAAMVRGVGPACAFVVDGVVMAIAGLIDFTPSSRCIIWCAFAKDAGKCFVALYRCMKRTMGFFPRRRYEAAIDPEFRAGRRLVELSGFHYEGLMRAFAEDGADRELWALVRKDT